MFRWVRQYTCKFFISNWYWCTACEGSISHLNPSESRHLLPEAMQRNEYNGPWWLARLTYISVGMHCTVQTLPNPLLQNYSKYGNQPSWASVSYFIMCRLGTNVKQIFFINALMGILKPHSNGPLYSNTVISIHWPLMGGLLHLVQRGGDCMSGAAARPGPSSLYQM